MEFIIYKDIPCPIIKFEKPDSYLIIYKNEQKWIYECSLGYGEILEDCFLLKYYLINEKFHREKGPAMNFHSGTKYWMQNDVAHRLDGPAMIYGDKYFMYYINGKNYDKFIYFIITKFLFIKQLFIHLFKNKQK